jgi:hypothetical protein
MEVAVEHRTGLTHRGRCPPGRSDREPRLEQLAHSRADTDGPDGFDGFDHRSKLAFGVGAASSNGDRAVEPAAAGRVDTDVHAQLPGAGAALTK